MINEEMAAYTAPMNFDRTKLSCLHKHRHFYLNISVLLLNSRPKITNKYLEKLKKIMWADQFTVILNDVYVWNEKHALSWKCSW